MPFQAGVLAKCLVGVGCLGTVSAGSFLLFQKGAWTDLDEEVYKATNSTWNGSVNPNETTITLTAGEEKEIKISASTTSPSSKTWSCAIKGTVPQDAGASITSKIGEQLSELKTNLGITNGSSTLTGQPNSQDKGKRFFDKCIKSRTFSEWWEAWKGNKAESTVKIEIKKESNNNNYKFETSEFEKLYKK